MLKISSVINLYKPKLASVIKQNNPYLSKILHYWEEIVGADLASHCMPNRLNGNLLKIVVYNSAASMELYYQKQQIIEKLGVYLGQDLIKDVIIKLIPKSD